MIRRRALVRSLVRLVFPLSRRTAPALHCLYPRLTWPPLPACLWPPSRLHSPQRNEKVCIRHTCFDIKQKTREAHFECTIVPRFWIFVCLNSGYVPTAR
eukprot:972501-Rhodomonas_salina.1